MPNLAVQINPASGNITIAHIVTTVVEEPSLRTTTTTTNSTPSPRTSSWGSNPAPDNQATPTPQGTTPMVQGDTPMPANDNSTPQDNHPSSQSATSQGVPPDPQTGAPSTSQNSDMDTSIPPNTSASSSGSHSEGQSSTSGQATDRPRDTSTVVNFIPQNTPHRDPLLPCQSFHFASLVPSLGQTTPVGAQRQNTDGQPGQNSTTGVISVTLFSIKDGNTIKFSTDVYRLWTNQETLLFSCHVSQR